MYLLDLTWNKVIQFLSEKISEDEKESFLSSFNNTKLVELNEDIAVITAKLKWDKILLSSKLDLIKQAFKQELGHEVIVSIETEDEYAPVVDNPFDDHVIKEFTFDNFVVGPSNKEAYMAAMACASNPKKLAFNPLFIYGDSGLGKTHLLCAVGNYYKEHYPSRKVSYISSSLFVQEVVDAIKENRIDQLKSELNNIDLLLVDDIQSLSGKDKTNEIFFGIYNELFNKRKQIIITSDRAPSKIKDIQERLVSRFRQGLTVTITSPEYETACEILKFKLKALHGIDVDEIDEEAISFMATNFSQDVRALEGAIQRILFYSINIFNNERITLNLTLEAFKNDIPASHKGSDTDISDVINAVADYYGLTKQQIISKTRTKNIANARHIAMYMCRKYLDASYPQIGKEFGGKDHTTVLSACEKIDDLVKQNESYRKAVSDIRKSLYG